MSLGNTFQLTIQESSYLPQCRKDSFTENKSVMTKDDLNIFLVSFREILVSYVVFKRRQIERTKEMEMMRYYLNSIYRDFKEL